MGCHTWCYKKVERTIEEARNIWIKEQILRIAEWTEIAENINHKYRIHRGYDQEFCNNQLLIFKRQLLMVQKGFCNLAVWNNQPEFSMYVENKGFFVEEGTRNPFRISGYPNDLLFSYDECMEYISKYEKEKNTKIEFLDNKKSLIKFWENNPNGMICFR